MFWFIAILTVALILASKQDESINEKTTKSRVIYIQDELDTIIHKHLLSPVIIKTKRNYHDFLRAFTEKFGDERSWSAHYKDSIDGLGKYLWKNIDALGRKNLEIELLITNEDEYYRISINIYDPVDAIINNDRKIRKFINKAFNERLLNRDIKMLTIKPKTQSFDLQEIVKINYDSLIQDFKKTIHFEEEISIKLILIENLIS